VVEVVVTAKASIPVALPFAGGVIAAGAVQVTPAGRVVGQTTVTGELNPPLDVTVIVEFTLAPVAELMVTGVELTVKDPPDGALTVKLTLFEAPPPGVGLVTVTAGVPAVAMSLAGTVTWICVAVIEEVVRAALVPKFTVAPLTKFVPFTVSVNAAPPAVALDGTSGAAIVGDAFEPVIVKVTGAELLAVKLASPL
jgi:hypothetical protein